METIEAKKRTNYVAFFLTLACNLNCSYCINHHGSKVKPVRKGYVHMGGDEWVSAANRLALRSDLPLTLQGGEPTLHKDFFKIVNDVKPEIKMDLMTNMMFDVEAFIRHVPVWRFTREAPYAAIRVSYHPGQNDVEDLIDKTVRMQQAGFRVGVYGIEHPDPQIRGHILQVRDRFLALGLDFRLKEFLGEHDGVMYGTFKFDGCVDGRATKTCDCRTSEIIVDSAGYVYRCHADLYGSRNPIGHILDDHFTADSIDEFRSCSNYGSCNPCDVKVKTNRFQVFGHTSVEIEMPVNSP